MQADYLISNGKQKSERKMCEPKMQTDEKIFAWPMIWQ